MNRIILIGNGFDLAHNMKTSYKDFIINYWETIIEKLKEAVNGNPTMYLKMFETEEIKIEDVPGPWSAGNWVVANNYETLIKALKSQNLNLIFKNEFLEFLTRKHFEKSWVDIENEYYELLKELVRDPYPEYSIDRLNKDFNQIKNLLETYLIGVEEKFFAEFGNNPNDRDLKSTIGIKIYWPYKYKDFTEVAIKKKVEIELEKRRKSVNSNQVNFIDIRKSLLEENAPTKFDLMPDEILFLNFNYTFTEKLYSDRLEFNPFFSDKKIPIQAIHIHGTTDKTDGNDIIFGFGDEIDEDYKSIENLNDNQYLENIKSIKYLETDNYKRLLEFLNSGDYQIFIFGHSCGISDRTLLNTLFEHKNCVSIKPLYHKKEDRSDNYSDIVRNISRNFNSKVAMRDKVVNKNYSEPLV